MSTANGSPSDQSPAPAAPAPAPAPAAAAASAPPPPSSASPPPPSQPSQAIASPTQPPLVTQVTQQSQSQSQSQPSSNSHPASQPLTQLPSLPVASSSQPDGKDKDGKDKDGKDREKEGDGEEQLSDLFAARREEEIARRDRSLAEFLVMLDGYKPLIPEEVTEYYLQRAGFECQDPRLKRLLSLSAQKFVSDLSRDAFHFAKLRVNSTTAGRGRPSAGVDRNRVVLTMDDLSLALGEHGVNVKKPDYYL